MNLDLNLLDTQVADPANAALADGDMATKLSAPILTPKKTVVTSTTLGNDWGVTPAATLKATLRQMIAGGGANGVLADYVLGVLEGAGFDPGNPQAIATAQQFVAAGIVTQDQINAAFYDTAYLCGDVVATADVTASRARVTRGSACDDLRRWINGHAGQVNAAIEAARIVTNALPDKPTLAAMFDPNN